MTKTRVVFLVLVLIAVAVVAASYLIQRSGQSPLSALEKKPAVLSVRVVCALPVEPFVTQAARQYNAEKHTLDGVP